MDDIETQADATRATSAALGSEPTFRVSPKKLFVAVFIGGSISVLTSLALDNPYVLGLAAPVTLLILYWVVGRKFGGPDGRSESFSDSTYYLGFLFTLVGLVTALLSLMGGNADLDDLVSKFGLALSTTVVGLFLRVYDVNFVHSIQERRRQAERELSRAIERFTDGLEVSSDKMDILFHGMTANVEQTGRALMTAAEEAANAILKSTKHNEERLEAVVLKIEESFTAIAAAHQIASESLITRVQEDIGKKLSEIAGSMVAEISGLTETSDRLKITHERIVSSFAESAENATNKWAIQMERLSKMPDLREAVGTEIQSVKCGLEEFSSEINLMCERMKEAASAFGSASELEGSARRLAETSSAVTKIAGQLEKLSAISTSMDTEKVQQQVGALLAVLNELRVSMEQQVATAHEFNVELKKDLVEGHDSLRQLQRGLADSAQIIIERLSEKP